MRLNVAMTLPRHCPPCQDIQIRLRHMPLIIVCTPKSPFCGTTRKNGALIDVSMVVLGRGWNARPREGGTKTAGASPGNKGQGARWEGLLMVGRVARSMKTE